MGGEPLIGRGLGGGVPPSVREADNGEPPMLKSQWDLALPHIGGSDTGRGVGGYGNLNIQEREQGVTFNFKWAYPRTVHRGGAASRSVGGKAVVGSGGY